MDFFFNDVNPSPVAGFFATGLLTIVDVSLNIVVSTLLETIFPAYDANRDIWWGALQATGEIILHVMVTNVLLYWSNGFLGTAGSLVPFGALVGIYLLTSARAKLEALQRHLVARGKLSIKHNAEPTTKDPAALE